MNHTALPERGERKIDSDRSHPIAFCWNTLFIEIVMGGRIEPLRSTERLPRPSILIGGIKSSASAII